MVEVEVFGVGLAPGLPPVDEVRRLCVLTAERRGVSDGHVAVEYVSSERIAELNERHRGKPEPTDVLSFPIDGVGDPDEHPVPEQRELGDVIICPRHTVDVREAIVHGMLHLLGMDHETDDGGMLALQDELMQEAEQ